MRLFVNFGENGWERFTLIRFRSVDFLTVSQCVSRELIHLMVLDGLNDVSSTGRRASAVRVGIPVEKDCTEEMNRRQTQSCKKDRNSDRQYLMLAVPLYVIRT